jgi:hypothetical protein
MVKNTLGLSRLSRLAKPGAAVFLVLLMSSSGLPHLKIYKELESLLLDISVNICLKGQIHYPMEQRHWLFHLLEHSGEAWRGHLPNPYETIYSVTPPQALLDSWYFLPYVEWENWLNLDLSGIGRRGSYLSVRTKIMEMSEGYTSVRAAYTVPPTKVGFRSFSPLLSAQSMPDIVKNYKLGLDIPGNAS